MNGNCAHPPLIETLRDLMTAACLVEENAGECLMSLARQMGAHNNPRMEELFAALAKERLERAKAIFEDMEPEWRAGVHAREARWLGECCPGAPDMQEAHYLMHPWHGLSIAREALSAAAAFFAAIGDASPDEQVRRHAMRFREEAKERMRALERQLNTTPPPPEGWDHDDDPPVMQE